MQREIVKFDVNVPQTVRLDFSDGKEVTSKAGSQQWQYTVNRNTAIMWLPLAGRQAIERSAAQAGDDVRILKSFLNQKTIWTAQVIAATPEQPAPAPLASAPLASAPQLAVVRNGNGKVNGLPAAAFYQPEHGLPLPVPPPALAEIPQVHPVEELYGRCLNVAARRNWIEWEAAVRAGYGYEPPIWEDVRASANTLFIERKGAK